MVARHLGPVRNVLERSRVAFLAAVLGMNACGGSSQGVEPSGAAAGAGGHGANGGSAAPGGTGGAAGVGAASGTGGAAGGAAGAAGGGEGGAKAGDGGDGGGGARAGSGGGGGGLVCSEQMGFAQRPPNPILRETTTGTNGTFTDECDANGMLKEYYCEYKTVCGPGMTDCAPYPTGEVISRTTACMFLCRGGGCLSPQP